MDKPKVLIICTGNSMRSQMAEGVLRLDLGDQIEVFSAGTHPSPIHKLTLEALAELGIDTSVHYPKSIGDFIGENMDLVITVCDSAHEICPSFPGAKKTVHKGYPDPLHVASGRSAGVLMAKLRDKMRKELRELVVKELGLK